MTITTAVPAGYVIEQVDVPTLPNDDLVALARWQQRMSRERAPEDPVTPLELIIRRFRNRPDVMLSTDWIVRDATELIAWAQVVRWRSAENPHWRDGWIGVVPEHRRRGLARALLANMVRAAGEGHDIVIGSWVSDRVPAGNEFARRIGATEGLSNRASRLRLAEIHPRLVAEWARLDPPGYRLVWIDGDVPDELMRNVIAAYDTMNTAPRGDLRFGDWHVTADEIRDWDRVRDANGGVRRLLLALHDATGETAGFTEVSRHPDNSWIVGQQGTAVVSEHRGHGIGKWIKARMLERILREWPDAQVVQTGNAYSNAPMLSINDRLGFKLVWSTLVWQLRIADARTYLEARGL